MELLLTLNRESIKIQVTILMLPSWAKSIKFTMNGFLKLGSIHFQERGVFFRAVALK